MDCTGLVNCICPRCFSRAVDRLREAENVSRQLRELAIHAIALKWDVAERTVTQALRR